MNKDEAKQAAELLAAIDAADPERSRTAFRVVNRNIDYVTIQVPATWEKDGELNRILIGMDIIPSRVFSSNKTSSNKKKIFQHILVYIDKIVDIDIAELEAKCKEYTAEEHKHTPQEWAYLVLHCYRTWLTLPGGLKLHRKVTPDMVRGYMKMRESYRHADIISALVTYGKWAKAHYEMVEANEFKPCWFHRWDLDELLLSRKAMKHLEEGWPALVRAKGIPDDYSGATAEREEKRFQTDETPEERIQKRIKYYAQLYAKTGEAGIDPEFWREHGDEIVEAAKEYTNAS